MVSGKKLTEKVAIKNMTINSLSKKLAVGKKMQLSVNTNPANASCQNFKWKSSNKKYATVNSKGVVTASRLRQK